MNGYRLSPHKPSWLRRRLSLFITCTLTALVLAAGSNSAYAQTDPKIQRSFINLSFEENAPVLDACTRSAGSDFVSDQYVAGWTTTHSEGRISCGPREGRPIELWSREFLDVAAHDGNIHAELNAHEEAILYQTVCLMEGDIVSFSFAHRSRVEGAGDIPMPDKDRMAFQLANDSDDPHEWSGETNVIEVSSANDGSAGTVHACIGSCAAPVVEGRWNIYSGQFNWTGATGLKRFGFRAIASASGDNSVGNFLDSISLAGIVPVIELDTTEAEGFEGEHNSSNFPANIVVSGNIPAGETLEVTLSIVHQETDAADVSPNDKIRIEIPSGNYAGEKFPIPLEIVKDDLAEDLESFRLEVDDQPGIYRAGSTSTCGAPGVLAMTYTIKDAHASIEKQGTFVDLVGGTGPDGLPIKNAGDRMDYVFTVTNNGGIDLNNIVVSDTIIGAPQLDPAQSDIEPDGRLKAGGKAVYLASYTLTQADIDRGIIANIATVTATLPDYPDQPPVTDTSEHSELIPHIPAISMVKTGAFDPETDNGNGLPDPGERLRFDITVTNGGNISAFNVQPDDPGPTFDGQPATGMMTPFTPGPVTLLPGEVQVFTAYYTLSAEDIAMGSGLTDAVANQASVLAEDPAGGPLEGRMPGPMKLTMPGFGVEKRAEITQAQRGGRVLYTLFLKPLGLVQTSRVRLADLMPPGFVYMPGTATVDGTPVEPLVAGRRLSWEIDVDPEDDVVVRLVLGVSASVSYGTFTNVAQAERIDNEVIYRQIGKADVEVMPEPVFDCGDIIGKVFNDTNRNGYQDKGEHGLPAARVATVDGMQITTDNHGRFHIACADLPAARVGSNFIMKLDPRSLPTGYRIISENPRTIRLTAGKASQVNFAASLSRVVRLDLSDAAFLTGSTELSPVWSENIATLLKTLETEPSILRITYRVTASERPLARQRLKGIQRLVTQRWKARPNRYRLEIESRLVVSGTFAGAER